jgi:hypothetical protein
MVAFRKSGDFVESRIRYCPVCGNVFFVEPSPPLGPVRVGPEYQTCVCGATHPTGKSEWVHLGKAERREYLWSGLGTLLILITGAAAVAGYLTRWHEPYWLMAVVFGFLGLLAGLICSLLVLAGRWLQVLASRGRAGPAQPLSHNG